MRRWAWILGGLILSAAALFSGVVYAKYRAGRSTPLPLSVPVTVVGIPEGADYVYDGSPYGIDYPGTELLYEGSTEGTDAGTYTAVFSLRDPVTECWEDGTREAKSVTMKIVPRPIVLRSESDTKPWDGIPLTNAQYTIGAGLLPEGSYANVPEGTERFENALAEGDRLAGIAVTGSQTSAGTSDNTIGEAVILNAAEAVPL